MHVAFKDGGSWRRFDPAAIEFLNRLCLECGDTQVVVASSWRRSHTRRSFSDLLRCAGFRGSLHEEWRTPEIHSSFRGAQVQAWLSSYPEISGYVILDDDGDFYPGQPPVKTDTRNGMMLDHYLKAREILTGEPQF